MGSKSVFCVMEGSISSSIFFNLTKEDVEVVLLKRHRYLFKLLKIFHLNNPFHYRCLKKRKYRGCNIYFDNESVIFFTKEQLNNIHRYNSLFVFLIDEIKNSYPSINNAKKLINEKAFDKVFTYSSKDARENGYEYSLSYYSKLIDSDNCKVTFDLFFIGNVKKRGQTIDSLLKLSKKNKLNNLIYLSGDTYQIEENNYRNIKYMPYERSLLEMLKCNCIVDLVDNDNYGQSLRYFEAVVYNKKLITNNQHIKELPFYNERYMMIINTIEDIDCNWVKKRDKVDYKYDGRFEPINLIKNMK